MFGGLPRAANAQGAYQSDIQRALAAMTPADWVNWQQRYAEARAANADFRVQSVEEFVKINAW
jgi:hypothetical protein